MSLNKLLVLSAFALASATVAAAPINQVAYASLTGTQIVDFDDLATSTSSGTNYDDAFVSRGVGFGERFVGQSLSASGNFDVLGTTAGGPLATLAGTANHNLDILLFGGSNVLTGLGTLGYPSFDAVGEGSFAALFSTDQSQFGFQLVGGDGGSAHISFFRRDGTLIDTVIVGSLANAFYGFSRDGGVKDIAGISIWNDDAAGIGFDNLKHDVVSDVPMPGVPEPETYALMLAGLGVVGYMARRRRAA
jgi:PEP-CTERM motif